jgi:copper chaperone CopZ
VGQLNLFVGGMSCRRCVREVTALVRDVPGVETVSANADDCTVLLTGSMEPAEVLAAFAGTGYKLRLDGIRAGDIGEVMGGVVDDDSDGTATGKRAP